MRSLIALSLILNVFVMIPALLCWQSVRFAQVTALEGSFVLQYTGWMAAVVFGVMALAGLAGFFYTLWKIIVGYR
jgi:hypothetical protein